MGLLVLYANIFWTFFFIFLVFFIIFSKFFSSFFYIFFGTAVLSVLGFWFRFGSVPRKSLRFFGSMNTVLESLPPLFPTWLQCSERKKPKQPSILPFLFFFPLLFCDAQCKWQHFSHKNSFEFFLPSFECKVTSLNIVNFFYSFPFECAAWIGCFLHPPPSKRRLWISTLGRKGGGGCGKYGARIEPRHRRSRSQGLSLLLRALFGCRRRRRLMVCRFFFYFFLFLSMMDTRDRKGGGRGKGISRIHMRSAEVFSLCQDSKYLFDPPRPLLLSRGKECRSQIWQVWGSNKKIVLL